MDEEGLLTLLRLLRLGQPLGKGQLQRLMHNLCANSETREVRGARFSAVDGSVHCKLPQPPLQPIRRQRGTGSVVGVCFVLRSPCTA